jgi:putative sigma-54 modulation protein
MAAELTFTFCRIARSGALEARIRETAEGLRRCDDRIAHCHIILISLAEEGVPAGGVNQASVTVKIHVSVPCAQIHADSTGRDGKRHTDVFLALRDAYESARRQLRDLQRDGGKARLFSGVGGSSGR